MSGFSIFQDGQYARVLNFQSYTGFTYFCKHDRLLNMRRDAIMEGFRVLNISRFQMCQVFPYVNVSQGPEYTWLWLNTAWINCSHHLTMAGFQICMVKVFSSRIIGLKPATLIKKETLTQAFFCESCEIFKNTFFTEHFRVNASGRPIILTGDCLFVFHFTRDKNRFISPWIQVFLCKI